MMQREKRSAMIFVASMAARGPLPGLLTYCCSKTFTSFLGQGLNYELKDKIDCLSWEPAEVKTKMLTENSPDEVKVGGGTLSVDVAVRDMFQQLGRETWTHGNWKHGMSGAFFSLFPKSCIHGLIYGQITKIYREKKQKESN